MTATTTAPLRRNPTMPPTLTPAVLAALPYLDFKQAVTTQLAARDNPAGWHPFYHPTVAARTLTVLRAVLADLDSQLAERNTAVAADVHLFTSQGLAHAADDRIRQHEKWKTSFTHFLRLTTARVHDLEGIVADTIGRDLLPALLALADAIRTHRAEVMDAEASTDPADFPDHDRALWDTLDTVTVDGRPVSHYLTT